jgi:hypothetical protein
MTNRVISIRTFVWLMMIVAFWATPMAGIAASLEPKEFGPSNYIPTLNKNRCYGTRSSEMPLGVQLYGPTGKNEPYAEELQLSLSSWVRNDVYWLYVEPENVEPAQYNWASADQIMRAYKDNCVNLIITIDGTPEWAKTSHIHGPFKNELLPEFVQFVGALVERYDGDGNQDAPGSPVVNYWEFYNEPDGGPSQHGDGWGVSGARYAAMLEAAYPIIKSANSNAKVVLGGLAYDAFDTNGGFFIRDFLKNVLEAGGGDYFDLMNFHYYPVPAHRTSWTTTNSSGLIEKTRSIKAELAAFDLDKDIIITEVGWHSNSTNNIPSSEEFQGRQVVQLLTQSLAEDIKIVIWWSFFHLKDYGFDTSLLKQNFDTKLAYEVYTEAVNRLGNATNIEVVVPATETNDLEVYRSIMNGTNKVQYIAWLNPVAPFDQASVPAFNAGATQTQEWQAPGAKATVYSKEGTLLQTITDGADGTTDNKVTIAVGRSPIYVVIN